MDDITIARAIHVLAVVHWIGGVAMVTAVILPAIRRASVGEDQLAAFRAIEGRFSRQARVSVTLAGLAGFYMTHRLDAWGRFLDPGYWWMHAMVVIWAIFTIALFVVEPLILHKAAARQVARNPVAALSIAQRLHWLLLTLSAITIAAAVIGVHGMLY